MKTATMMDMARDTIPAMMTEWSPTEFMYAEIEYTSEDQARSWNPADFGLSGYLCDDVTGQPGQTMGAYWTATRLRS